MHAPDKISQFFPPPCTPIPPLSRPSGTPESNEGGQKSGELNQRSRKTSITYNLGIQRATSNSCCSAAGRCDDRFLFIVESGGCSGNASGRHFVKFCFSRMENDVVLSRKRWSLFGEEKCPLGCIKVSEFRI